MSHVTRSCALLGVGAAVVSLGLSACFPFSLGHRGSSGSSSGGSSGGSSASSSGPVSAALDMYVGQCIQDPGEGSISEVENAVCTKEHWGEVYHVATITSSRMPSDGDMDDMALDVCVDAFDAYVGRPYDESDLDITWYFPSRESWDDGDRSIQCIAFAMDGESLYQPVRNSGI